MQLFHNSHDSVYRKPFGAVPTDSIVRLGLKVIPDSEVIKNIRVRIWVDNEETFYDMSAGGKKIKPTAKTASSADLTFSDDPVVPVNSADSADVSDLSDLSNPAESSGSTGDTSVLYTAKIKMPSEGALIWYYFIIETENGTVYYTNNPESLGGVGTTTADPMTHSYQITVYDKDYKTPDWFKGNIMYQIFTDRFYGDHTDTNHAIPKKRNEYVIHNDWYEAISFNKHPYEMGPACNDFYGGNLKGIIQKLPYLKSLGVGVIYLNPIFDAYSNHKYDTADYKNIDPMFGTNEIFSDLCHEAKKLGIRIILDGVFSHTCADSIYFNKDGSYGSGVGAYQNPQSPYREWYQFTNFPNYESWWGCSNLPNVNEMTPSYLDYILRDNDSVVKTWIGRGASGWRLDVADELPDEFIQILRKEVKEKDPDAVIIGEVWEDASNKVAYSVPRKYLFGHELDSVMNYPFKDNMIAFILGSIDAETLNAKMMSIMENYPKETLYALMNIIGTHDTVRIKTIMGGLSNDCGTQKLSSGNEELATYRIKMLSFVQMTYVGVPCIYYGDEVGMQGGSDPFNRGTYPWRAVDSDLRQWYTELGNLRNSLTCLKLGEYKTLYALNDLFVYARYISGGKDAFGNRAEDSFAVCAINRSFERRHVDIDLSEFGDFSFFSHGIGKTEIKPIRDNILEIDVAPLGCEFFLSADKF